MTDEQQKKVFAKNLNYYINLNGKLQNEVAKDIGEKPTTFNMWCTGKSIPSVGKIQKLADYFKIGKSDLTDDKSNMSEDEEYTSTIFKIGMQDKRFSKIIVEYYKSSQEEKEIICDFFEKVVFKKGRN